MNKKVCGEPPVEKKYDDIQPMIYNNHIHHYVQSYIASILQHRDLGKNFADPQDVKIYHLDNHPAWVKAITNYGTFTINKRAMLNVELTALKCL